MGPIVRASWSRASLLVVPVSETESDEQAQIPPRHGALEFLDRSGVEGQRFSGTLELAALLLCIAWRGKGKVLADGGDGYGNLLNLPLYLYSYRYGRISDKNL